jgi:hypothetical protein
VVYSRHRELQNIYKMSADKQKREGTFGDISKRTKLSSLSPRAVGIVRPPTQATEFRVFFR